LAQASRHEQSLRNIAMKLTPFFHPSMKLPFKIQKGDNVIELDAKKRISDLMDETEDLFANLAQKAGENVELQINVLWNMKDFQKALNPTDKVQLHFVDGESFGVFGDVVPAQNPPLKEEDKLPVVILTGFLGSGKTTLLNYMLQEQKEKKIAVIENEFGEVSIDDALLKQDKTATAEKIIVMDNGCMCCTIRGDLINALRSMIDEVRKGHHLDVIVIETTGMADPAPIIRTFFNETNLTEELRLDGVVTLADAKHLSARLDDDDLEEGKVNVAYQQVAFADKIILNKLDLVTAQQAIDLRDRIRGINKFAKILPAVQSRIKLNELTNMRAHDLDHFTEFDLEKEADVDQSLEHGHGGDGGHGGHNENHTEEHRHGGGHGENEGREVGHEGGHGGSHGDGHGDNGGHDVGHGSGHDGGQEDSHRDDGVHGAGHGHAIALGHGGFGHGHGHGHGSTAARHDGRINSFSMVREGNILPRRLKTFFGSLGAWPKESGIIFRVKAILAVKNHPFKYVYHSVMDVGDEKDAATWAEGERRISKIVFIGKNLDQASLRKRFEDLFED